jgi:glutathione-regulated potassium-efflux system protein KefB
LDLLRPAFVFLAAAVVAVPLATRLGLGSVLGYLVAGVVVGPHGLGLGGDPEAVLQVAEFGVVLLLFLVGLELDPARLAGMRRNVLLLGGLQVFATAGLLGGGALALGVPWRVAVVAALGLSLSSTALVVQLLSERRELGTSHGRAAFGILLFQDLAVIPVLAILPLLAPPSAGAGAPPPAWRLALTALLVVAAVALASRFVVRPVLRVVASMHDAELFTATALLLVVATALGVARAGLSMALGAFLAGVLLAGSQYRHELEADIAPFKGLLLGLFFIAVGMSADLGLLASRPLAVLGLVAALVVGKSLVGFAIGRAFLGAGDPAASLAVLLAQGGEFAFVLFKLAAAGGIMARGEADLLVVAVTLSMVATPAVFAFHRRVVRRWLSPRAVARPYDVAPEGDPPVIIAGFGRVGQVVGRVLRAKRIPFTAIDISAEHIEFVQRFGNKVFFGDVTRLDLLRAARAGHASLFVLAIDDVDASVRTAELVRAHFPNLRILARARNRQHAYRLRRAGVTELVRETFAASLELTQAALEALGEEPGRARSAIERFRSHDEALLEQTWRHADDPEKLIELSRRGRAELEKLFEEDAADRRTA